MKKELIVLAASLALASSMNASVNHSSTISMRPVFSSTGLSLMAREKQPGDKKGKGQDGKGHKLMQQLAREAEPGDKRHGRGKDDPKGHKVMQQIAREVQPSDQRHGRGKDDPKGHKLMQQVAREGQPGDDRGRGRGRGNDDGKGHKLV